MKKVLIKCKAAKTVPLKELEDFQGNLKKLSKEDQEKLTTQILDRGFSFPVCIWENEEGNKFILDGHQRTKVLRVLQKEGYRIPKIPVAVVEAPTYADAKKKLLAAASQFGSIDNDGLYQYMQTAGLTLEEVIEGFRFSEIDFKKFSEEYGDGIPEFEELDDLPGVEDVKTEEAPEPLPSDTRVVQLFFNQSSLPSFIEHVQKLQDHFKLDNLTETVYRAVREVHGGLQN